MKPVLNFQSTPSPQRSSRWQRSSRSKLWAATSARRSTIWPARSNSSSLIYIESSRQQFVCCRLAMKSKEGSRMFTKFLKDESGLELSEYAVAAALVALAAVLAFQTLGGNISSKINELAGKLQ